MNAPWLENLACYWAQILIVVLVGASVRQLLRLAEPRVVLRYWQVLLGICLGLPLLEPWKPVEAVDIADGPVVIGLVAGSVVESGTSPLLWRLFDSSLVALVLLAGVFIRLVWVVVGLVRLSALKGRAVRLPASGLPLGGPAKIGRTRFYVTSELNRPATFGVREPVVLLPVRALELSEIQLRSILLHELEHVRGRHWVFAICEELVRSIFWFHPAISWLVRSIRLAREQVIDACVISQTGGRRSYLQALVEMARAGAGIEMQSASSFLSPHELTARATLILKEPHMSRKRLFLAITGVVPLLAASTLVAVWAFPLRAVPPLSPIAVVGQPGETSGDQFELTKRTAPVYPAEAKAKGIQGSVLLHLNIDRTGKVSGVKVAEGHELLRQAAVDAVRAWEYKPLIKDGKAVPFETDVKVNFKLGDGENEGGKTVVDEKRRVPGSPGVVGGVPGGGGAPGGVVGGVPGGVKGGVPGGVKGGVPGGVKGGVNDSEPNIVDRSVVPEYPAEAKEKKIQGSVTLEVMIDERGQVSEAQLVDGPDIFKESAVAAVRAWKWAPAMKDGVPVPAEATVTINYKLQ